MAFAEHGLGKSLSDVFARTPRKEPSKGFIEVDIAAIIPPLENPRKQFDAQSLRELASSIALHGILQPIVVMRRDSSYEVLSGERRYRAAKMAGLTKVPVVIRDVEQPQHLAELRLIENIQRENLNPIELAKAYQALIDQHGLTHEELAERLSKERSGISNSLRLLTLPEQIQDEVSAGALSHGHAKALLSVTTPSWLLTLARKAIEEHLSVREVEALAKEGPPASAPEPAASVTKAPHIQELETNLFHLFGTRVAIKERNGKGSLTLRFDSRDHFQRVIAILDRVMKQANQPPGSARGPEGG